ncbi:hypothetical protein M407DRAFT_21442 [Tulasnella calospora MUT 4182]|uniref:Endonuclease/exonuclease/phosphatase domain-containing protein n=1 Tax=Tulasnella calospora MUT 4182 TaxID=1051891 RepID=A0A0C3M6W4_9AGAM|nr:hypothetical protein M407DRAFT_21442 [Tulasnella calospora MUT 4182]
MKFGGWLLLNPVGLVSERLRWSNHKYPHPDNIPAGTKREDVTHTIVEPGRADTLTLKWGQEDLKITNVYAPNNEGDAIEFFANLEIALRRSKTNVMLGDFNHVADKDDRLPRMEPSSRIKKALASLGITLAIADQWRAENPGTRQYSWTNSHENADGSTSISRLDRVLLDDALRTRATSWNMLGLMGLSDHQIVSVNLLEKNPPFIGEPRWRMNLEDIEDNECMEMARLALLKAQKSLKAGKDAMATWLRAKDEIRNVAPSRQTMKRKERGRHLRALEKDRVDLMGRRDFPKNVGLQDRALAIDERISEIKKSKLDRAAEYSAARSLKDKSGSLKTATEDMAKIATKHHSTHQARQPMIDACRNSIARMLTMTDGKRATSAAKTKLSERFKAHSTPGGGSDKESSDQESTRS